MPVWCFVDGNNKQHPLMASSGRLLLAAAVLLAAGAAAFTRAEEITVNIRAHYDGTMSSGSYLALRGDALGLNWNSGMKMTKSSDTMWNITLSYDSSLAGSQVEMKALINDQTWQIGANSIVKLSAKDSYFDFYPWFHSHAGSYKIIGSVYSPQLNNSRDVIVYFPPSFSENTLKPMKNVLVMHDGENLFNASTSFGGIAWDCQDTINQLVNEGLMEEVFIIGLYNTPNRNNEYTYSYDPTEGFGGLGDHYINFIIQVAIPYVKTKYPRIQTGRENLGILGSSLGGLISCWGVWTRPSVFSKGGCMSSSFWWNAEDFNNIVEQHYPRPHDVQIYVDSGDAGPSHDDVEQTRRVYNHAIDLGFVANETLFYYLDPGGQHGEYWWGRRFHVPMTDLYPPNAVHALPVADNAITV